MLMSNNSKLSEVSSHDYSSVSFVARAEHKMRFKNSLGLKH